MYYFRASDSIKTLTIRQRKCIFRHEIFDPEPVSHVFFITKYKIHSFSFIIQKYSGKLCELKCRAESAKDLCGCIPFYYPFVGKLVCILLNCFSIFYISSICLNLDGPECTLTGLICLQQHTWPVWNLRSCKCLTSCVHYKYLENDVRRRLWYE